MSGVGPGIIDIVDFANSVPTHARTKVRAYTAHRSILPRDTHLADAV